jgi:predicted secreted hydrolase
MKSKSWFILKFKALLASLFLTVLLLAACGDNPATRESFPAPSPNPQAGQIQASLPGPVAGATVNFPQDEAPHNDLMEWWYYTGHLNTTDGLNYGFEYVIFQVRRSNFPAGYVSHFAITDLNKQSFKYDQQLVASHQPYVPGSLTGFSLAAGSWTMQGLGGTDHLKATMQDNSYGIDLTVQDQKGPVLHGTGEFSYGPAGFSYYYSRPRMQVTGQLQVDGQTKTIQSGVAWFDHQWGDFIPMAGGWDWFSLHLSDDTELMVYYLRDDRNNVADVFGTYVPACAAPCETQSNKPVKVVELHREDFNITPTGHWTSPRNGGVYPAGWNVKVKAEGMPALDLNVKPALADQELDTSRTTGLTYWEGACTVVGTKDNQPLTGQAYVELTGYARSQTTPAQIGS